LASNAVVKDQVVYHPLEFVSMEGTEMSKVKVENSKEVIMSWFEADDNDYKRAQVLAYIQDKKIPFEDRKEVWMNTPEHLATEHGWIIHLDKFDKKYGEISWFDDFYCDRRQRVHLPDLLEYSFFETDGKPDEQKQNDFIKECMEKGIHSFTLDW
jgi:hypothetical protein